VAIVIMIINGSNWDIAVNLIKFMDGNRARKDVG
jgi:hypothetical protein